MSEFTNSELARMVKQGINFADMYLELEQELKDCRERLKVDGVHHGGCWKRVQAGNGSSLGCNCGLDKLLKGGKG